MKLNDDTQDLMIRAAQAFNGLRKIFTTMESVPVEISLSKLDMLSIYFLFQKGELTMSSLAKDLSIGVSTATGIADRLFDKKLISRKRNFDDRRIVKIKLTGKGKQIALVHQKQIEKALGKALSILTKEEQQNLILIMEKIAKKI